MTTDLQQQVQASLGSAYLIERELGGGGMSRVFLAEERRLGRRVVVKVLSPELAAGLSVDRFEREIRLAAQLQDPRIVQLLQAGHVQDLPFYTMPYVEGESLRARLARGSVPLDRALRILRDVALALEYAHTRNVVHRDIKPENVLLTGHTALVVDFGIAKAVTAATHAGSQSTLTALGAIVGTPAYMAPEQAAGDPVDARADLYAWGVIAYEMLAGVHPFAGHTTAQALLAAHIADAPRPLAERRPDLPRDLTALVDRCLEKNPSRRPADARALAAQLELAERPARAGAGRPSPRALAAGAGAVVLMAAAAAWLYRGVERRAWAKSEAVSEGARLQAADLNLAAFHVLERAAHILPTDTAIARAIADNTKLVAITSTPPGATVAIRDYLTPDSAWQVLGQTPLGAVRLPAGYFRWRVTKPGFTTYVAAPPTRAAMRFPLDSIGAAPPGMTLVPAANWSDYVDFVGWTGPYRLPAFYMDRFEVSNRQYQEFVDQGGYRTPRYWSEPFVENGRTLSWQQAMARFRDRSGREGPSTWEAGHYPAGEGDYPVSGVSWYEAAAYAAFAGKTLPTFAQWHEAAPPDLGRYVVAVSNVSRKRVAAVGAFQGLGPFGTYDMAGNVNEWNLNALLNGLRFNDGGAWDSPEYAYADPTALSPFDRSPENGFRCVRNLGPLPPDAVRPVRMLDRDFSKVRPASDAVFRAYRVLYAYDHTPLNAKDDGVVQDTQNWTEEKVTFDAAYGNQRLAAYLFLPKRVRPPYQTVVFFPSARVLDLRDSHRLGDVSFFDYVVESGRAVVYPIYQGTYERHATGNVGEPTLTVERSKDLERTLDYLATRPDIAKDKLAYMGVSMGAAGGVIYATLAQDRLKTVILLDGGFFLGPPPQGADQADFAPRLRIPVLMVNGRYDPDFSLQRAQLPLFRMLGTPASDKRHVLLETPHDVREGRPTLVTEVLGWLDKYLGRVE